MKNKLLIALLNGIIQRVNIQGIKRIKKDIYFFKLKSPLLKHNFVIKYIYAGR